jgi:hypothetical protein
MRATSLPADFADRKKLREGFETKAGHIPCRNWLLNDAPFWREWTETTCSLKALSEINEGIYGFSRTIAAVKGLHDERAPGGD